MSSRLVLAIAFLWLFAAPAFPHGGGLDRYGCHHNRVQGGYHCHRGPFKGAMFHSQEEMLQELERVERAAPPSGQPREETRKDSSSTAPARPAQ